MRIIQFRRHLGFYVVRVTDSKDIELLTKHKAFSTLMVVKQKPYKNPKGPKTIISAEFFGSNIKVDTLKAWKEYVWSVIKYRKYNRKRKDK